MDHKLINFNCKIRTILKWSAWVMLTVSIMSILKALIPPSEDSHMMNGMIMFFAAYVSAHLAEIE